MIIRKLFLSLILCTLIASFAIGAESDSGPGAAPAGVDEKLWKQLVEIDARGARIEDLSADFTQEKHTALLKKPLVSTGHILIKGSASLWKTTQPEPTVMRIDNKEVRLYYPRQKVLEIYRTDDRMGSLAASPFPRLAVIKSHFTFERVSPRDLLPSADETKYLALRMHPIDAELKKHIDEVTVVLEIATGFVARAQTIDADGDRVVLAFSNLKINSGLKDDDLKLQVPADVEVTRPLEGQSDQGQGK